MAKKKSRTPPPPKTFSSSQRTGKPPRPAQPSRSVQAPRAPRAPSGGRRRLLLIGGAGVIVVAVAAVGIAMAVGGGGGGGKLDLAALSAAGCTAQTLPSQGRNHVNQLPEGFSYNSFPPTSGPHHPVPAIWNWYDEPVQQVHLVHNLEHGGIVVQYGDQVPQSTIDSLRAWYNSDPVGIVVAPLPGLHGKVALTAWTHLATCPGFDDAAFNSFRDAYRYGGPERFSPEAMQPGT